MLDWQRLKKISVAQKSERDRKADVMRDSRMQSTQIFIAAVKDEARRRKAQDDPEFYLRTYFEDRYRLEFGKHHRFIINTMMDIFTRGGDQALAAPRGIGKTEVAKGMLTYFMLFGVCSFPLVVAANSAMGHAIYADVMYKLERNDKLYEDFPEVCGPIRDLQGAPQRAIRQHVDGHLTHIEWKRDEHIVFPTVPTKYRFDGMDLGGTTFTYRGMDAAIRGININGRRPRGVLIDDPETAESARSDVQIESRDELLKKDVSGLKSQDDVMGMLIVTTVQNSKCLSARVTDREKRPEYNGIRFAMVQQWPERMDLWKEYVARRQMAQSKGDVDGIDAVDFYLANREAMDAGVEMLSDDFVQKTTKDGKKLLHSAIQQAFNVIAKIGFDAYSSEYQNDPKQEEQDSEEKLTPAIVMGRNSGLKQSDVPTSIDPRYPVVTVGIDLGKWYCHWVKCAWMPGATGYVLDYGKEKTHRTEDNREGADELAIRGTLSRIKDLVSYANAPVLVLVDSGNWTDVAYKWCQQAGQPFFPSKGWDKGRFRLGTESDTRKLFEQCFAQQQSEGNWLYNVNTEYWKMWVQRRFLTPWMNDDNVINFGAMACYDNDGDVKRHQEYADELCAEGMTEYFEPGKGIVRKWCVNSKKNHYLDATTLAAVAARCYGVELIEIPREIPVERPKANRFDFSTPYGQFLATERTSA